MRRRRDKNFVANHLDAQTIRLVEAYLKDRFDIDVKLTSHRSDAPITRINGLMDTQDVFLPEMEHYPFQHGSQYPIQRHDLVAWLDERNPGWDKAFTDARPWRPFYLPNSALNHTFRPDIYYSRAVRLVREDNVATPRKIMDYFSIGEQRARTILNRMQAEGVIDGNGAITPFNISELYR